MQLSLLSIPGVRTAGAFILVSLVIATLFDVEDIVEVPTEPTQELPSGIAPSPGPADLMSVMQSVVHVDLLGLQDREPRREGSASALWGKRQSKDVDDTTLLSGIPIVSKSKTRRADASFASLSSKVTSWRALLRQTVKQTVLQASTAGIAIVMLVLLIGCTCLAAVTIVHPDKFPWSRRQANTPYEEAAHTATIPRQQVMMFPKSPGAATGGASQGQVPGAGTMSPFAQALMRTPVSTAERLPSKESLPVQNAQDAPRPPPLCPSLVMPICEARFGIPMYELAELSAEGELNVVGLSGNPLLKAVIRKIGTARTLEISMPDHHSAPRATISPPTQELAGHGQQGSRALEIRGMYGSFYGMLEMRSTGACYVVRNSETVLTIDGDAESLQLSIKSSVGLQLASVRCSAEPFGGVDHVEIRVEPGVDTVLVLAVVLAVLLLSPYLPPSDP